MRFEVTYRLPMVCGCRKPNSVPLGRLATFLISTSALLPGCGGSATSDSPAAAGKNRPTVEFAEGHLYALRNSQANGSMTFVKKPSGSTVLTIELEGLEPAQGRKRYAIWQTGGPDKLAVVATPHVPRTGLLSFKVNPPPRFLRNLENGIMTHILITLVHGRPRSGAQAEAGTGWPSYVGTLIAAGTWKGDMVDVANRE